MWEPEPEPGHSGGLATARKNEAPPPSVHQHQTDDTESPPRTQLYLANWKPSLGLSTSTDHPGLSLCQRPFRHLPRRFVTERIFNWLSLLPSFPPPKSASRWKTQYNLHKLFHKRFKAHDSMDISLCFVGSIQLVLLAVKSICNKASLISCWIIFENSVVESARQSSICFPSSWWLQLCIN